MYYVWRVLIVFGFMAFTSSAVAESFNYQRAMANYRAVIEGQKTLKQLSEQEQREVMAVVSVMRSRGSTSDDESSECSDAKGRANSAASDLAGYAKRLANCAERADLSDDCGSEFRRVKNAEYEYESAVSNVRSSCS